MGGMVEEPVDALPQNEAVRAHMDLAPELSRQEPVDQAAGAWRQAEVDQVPAPEMHESMKASGNVST